MHNRIMQKSWFRTLFGEEESRGYRQLQENFELLLNGTELKSKVNNKTYRIGNFSTPTLAQIRNEALSAISIENNFVLQHSKPSYEHIEIGDAFLLHIENPNATIQAASQFNCLEFTSHKTNPEHGVSIYEYDNTQGPACALACAAGTVFRNYFVVVDPNSPNIRGQTKNNQINNLDNLEDMMNNKEHQYWYVENGYTFSRDNANLVKLNERIEQEFSSVHQRNTLLDAIKVGVHSDVGVTFESRYRPVAEGREVSVTQVYCSAISCAYSGIGNNYWEPLAKLALDAAYEATLWAAVLNAIKHEAVKPVEEETCSAEDAAVQSTTSRTAASNTLELLTEHIDNTASIPQPIISHHKDVFLTFLGGGVFRNDTAWIANAIGRAIAIVSHHKPDLNIKICHFRNKDHLMAKLIDESYTKNAELVRNGEEV